MDKSGATGDAAPLSAQEATGETRSLSAQESTEHALRAASFGAAAQAYAEHRPDYPAAAIRWALGPVALPVGRPVRLLDLGAGTGKLTAALASLSIGAGPAAVVAVEPDPDMLAELRHQLPGVTALPGRAESIPLADGNADAVLVGQAARWFDPDLAMPEIARVLAPGGILAAFWNADDDRVDWVAGLHRVSGRTATLAFSAVQESDESDGMTDWLSKAGQEFFWPPEPGGFEHAQRRTADSMIETMRTYSTFLIMEPAEREATLAKVRDYLAATPQTGGGEFSIPLHTFAVRAIRR